MDASSQPVVCEWQWGGPVGLGVEGAEGVEGAGGQGGLGGLGGLHGYGLHHCCNGKKEISQL